MEPESTPTVHSGELAAVQPRTLADKLRNWQAASCATATDTENGLRDRNSPTCTLSQNGYGAGQPPRARHTAATQGSPLAETHGAEPGPGPDC